MSPPGMMLMGAKSRLLPPSIPFRFFLAAVVFHVVAWGLLAGDAEGAASFVGGPGFPLAALHALTLGVFVMTAMGATLQILPIAVGLAPGALWPMRLVWWLYAPGTVLAVWGFAKGSPVFMALGGGLVVAGLAVFGVIVGEILRRTQGLRVLVAHSWTALAALVGLAGLGLLLVVDVTESVLDDHMAVAGVHMIVAGYGFMGLLALGYAHILVPMFALGPAPAVRPALIALGLAGVGILAAVTGLLGHWSWLVASAAGVGVVVGAIHLWAMRESLAKGMRKSLGVSFVLVRVGWLLLPTSLVVGGASALGLLGWRGPALFVVLLIPGWLLTFLLGILQRIIPFLAAMNADGGRAPRLSRLAPDAPLIAHATCHLGAVAILAVGVTLESPPLVLTAALIGLAGAVMVLGVALNVLVRMRGHWRPPDEPGPSRPSTEAF